MSDPRLLPSAARAPIASDRLLVGGSLRQLILDDNVLARVDGVLDRSWLRDEVAETRASRAPAQVQPGTAAHA